MAVLKCKMCAGNIIPVEGKNLGVCDSCGSTVTMPSITDERRADAFNRGNHFRQVYEFDQALREYSQIVQEDPQDAEAHWCMTLCRYGINYHQDHRTGQRIPTCDRVSYTSILEDPDYKAALKYADGDRKAMYQAEAQKIYAIQQGILEVSAKEKPFDVFICFKDTDDKTGKRTPDSVLAQDLYTELVKRDYKVFFSRITLKEEHMGQEWEPYIFAALNSAKVMLVVGTSPENFSSPWVKNEWSRFLNLRRMDKTKILIPCVSGMNPNALPAGLKELEGRDMSEISFMQDILYGIERVVRGDRKKSQAATGNAVTAENYVKRAFMALEDADYQKANQLLEQALNLDPENGQAHLGKLLVERQCTSVEELAQEETPLSRSGHYNRAVKYGDLAAQQKLRAAESQIQERLRLAKLEENYQSLCEQLDEVDDSDEAKELITAFEKLGGYKDSATKLEDARHEYEYLLYWEAEERKRREETAKQEAAEKEKKAAEERVAQAKAAKRARRQRRNRRIRKLLFFLIVLGVLGYFGNKKFLEEPRTVYEQAGIAMERGDYQVATVKYFAVAEKRLSGIFFPDAGDKAIEACTAWLGWEPTVVTSEEYPWLSLDDEGNLEFDSGKYETEESLTLPTVLDGQLVTGFAERCFQNSGITALSIPANYTYIGPGAFRNCQSLTSVELGAYTAYISEDAFYDCDSLTNITIPDSTVFIGAQAFANCDYLSSVSLGNGVEEIDEGAFLSCKGLTSITIPSSVSYIGSEAFCRTSLVSLTLESGMSGIGERAFAECDYLTEVYIPGSCTEIGPGAFYSCDALGTVTLESGVEVLGEKAFSECTQLWNLGISDTLTTIGASAFYKDMALGSISLPATLTTIGESAFAECDGIGEVWILDNNGLVIGDEAFTGCDSLTGAYLGAGTAALGNRVFRYCEAMTWVSMPEGLLSIGERCFSATDLAEVTIPSTVTTIGEAAFHSNASLVGVQIPPGVSILESNTFQDCTSLYWVWFSDGLSIVRDDAFYGCSNLTQVYFSGTTESWNAVSKGNNEVLTRAELYADYYG